MSRQKKMMIVDSPTTQHQSRPTLPELGKMSGAHERLGTLPIRDHQRVLG